MENSIIDKLKKLELKVQRISPDVRKRMETFSPFHALTERFLNDLENKDTYDDRKADKALYKIGNWPVTTEKIVDVIENDLFAKGLNAASGGHLGYIPGGGIYTAAIADYMAAISNVYSGVYYASPGAVEMEHACLDWIKSIFNFPKEAVGNLTSGGSTANLIALAAARDQQGVLDRAVAQSVVYMTDQTHHSLLKALNIIGLNKVTIRLIPTDGFNRMDADELSKKIKEDRASGLFPAIIIANAGTTDTGAIDPLEKIATIAQENKIWLHIDAAYGGFFILTKEGKEKFKGIGMADSITCDPHKALFLPYGIGAVIIKNKDAVFSSNKLSANYMQDTVEAEYPIDPADVSPELTKHFRALRMWLPLKVHGTAPFKAALEEKLLLTHYFRVEIEKLDFKTGPTPDLSVTYFWYPFGEGEDAKNQQLIDLCHKDGRVFLSSTKIQGKFVIRMAIVSFRTHRNVIDKAIEMVKDCLKTMA